MPAPRIIVALDVPDAAAALALATRLDASKCSLKVGKELFTAVLAASAHSTPITYMGKDGKQYVVVPAAGGTAVGSRFMSDELIAFALP